MKNLNKYILLVMLAVVSTAGISQERRVATPVSKVAERLYLVTDRDAYIAGESIWVSLYCFDITKSKGTLSQISSVAYVEIQNSKGVVSTAKIHLNEGRGSGKVDLPPAIPTGSYKIVAYTKAMNNEESLNLFSKSIPVFNTLTTDRVEGNVKVTDKADQSGLNAVKIPNSSLIEVNYGSGLSVNNSYPVVVKNLSGEQMDVVVSVKRKADLPAYVNESFSTFMSSAGWNSVNIRLTGKVTPEYEGEIVNGNVSLKVRDSVQYIAYLAAVGKEPNIYTSYVSTDGKVKFFTNSIFGNREAVLEIPGADTNNVASLILEDSFLKPNAGTFPELLLNKSIELPLRERSIEMQLGRRFGVDTLFEMMKIRKDPLLNIQPKIYKLDDYTRFPVMQEVVVEYIPELRFRTIDKEVDLQVRWNDAFNSTTYSRGGTLALVDGIPVFSHKKIYDYDPLKIKTISIYGAQFLIGAVSYDGLVLLSSYKGDYPGLKLGKNVKIVDFQGVQYPCMFSGSKVIAKENHPDLRSLLYWNPKMGIDGKGEQKFLLHTSGMPGKYVIEVVGMSEKGEVISYSEEIEIR